MVTQIKADPRLGEKYQWWIMRGSEISITPRTTILRRFLTHLDSSQEFKDSTSETLISYMELNPTSRAILKELQKWIIIQCNRGLRAKSLQNYYATIRSFFDHNGASLPIDKSFRIPRAKTQKVKGKLESSEIAEIILGCNTKYRAIYACMAMSGMGGGELVKWSNTGLQNLIQQLENKDPIRVEIMDGRKRNLEGFHTFIGGTARKFLEIYVNGLPREERIKDRPIFTVESGRYPNTPITTKCIRYYWLTQVARVGLIKRQNITNGDMSMAGRIKYGKSLHELRDSFRTLWSKNSGNPDIAEFFLGHRVDLLGYNKIGLDENYTKAEYLRMLPKMDVFTMRTSQDYAELRTELDDVKKVRADEMAKIRDEMRAEMMKLIENFKTSYGIQPKQNEVKVLVNNNNVFMGGDREKVDLLVDGLRKRGLELQTEIEHE